MKRFFEQTDTEAVDGGFTVTLDGKAVKTPARNPLVLPNDMIALVIAREWSAQKETIAPDTMPTMTLAATAIDRVADHRAAVVDEVAAYGETDLLCYRAAEPEDLQARQAEGWQPLLDWCADRYGATLKITEGVVAISQDSAALDALRAAIEGYGAMSLTALHSITTATGSLVIALALADRHIDARKAWMLSRIDEMYQAQKWGMDQEARDKTESLRVTLFASSRFIRMCNHDKLVIGGDEA